MFKIIFIAVMLVSTGAVAQNKEMTTPKDKGYRSVNGLRLYYEIYGSGKPLVLIHGGGGSILNDFQQIIPLLQNDFQVIGIDLQNHGRSEHRNKPATFEQDADDVAELLKQLNIEKASFLGFSNGGNTVMQIAVRHPELAEKIIVASAFFKQEGMMNGFFDGFENATLDMMPASLQENFLKLNPDRNKLQNMFEKDSQRMKTFKDWNEGVLRSIKAPALIINGDRDVVLNIHAAEMQSLIPNSRLMILPATHGSYLMADMEGKVNKSQIEFTIGEVVNFLNNNL